MRTGWLGLVLLLAGCGDTLKPSLVCDDFGEGSGNTTCRCHGRSETEDYYQLRSCAPPDDNSYCCADLAYPAAGQACECTRAGCSTTSSKCTCQNQSVKGPATSCAGTWATCCQSRYSCECSNATACAGGTTRVASCSVATMGCEAGKQAVASCGLASTPR